MTLLERQCVYFCHQERDSSSDFYYPVNEKLEIHFISRKCCLALTLCSIFLTLSKEVSDKTHFRGWSQFQRFFTVFSCGRRSSSSRSYHVLSCQLKGNQIFGRRLIWSAFTSPTVKAVVIRVMLMVTTCPPPAGIHWRPVPIGARQGQVVITVHMFFRDKKFTLKSSKSR